MKKRYLVLIAGLLAIAAAACSKSEKPSTGTDTTESAATAKVDLTKAKEVFQERCSACHGSSGKGDGPGSAALNPKPRNYGDKAWQASVTDEQIRKTIIMGGAAVGKSPIMPASPDLEGKPEVVDGLVQVVRSFGR